MSWAQLKKFEIPIMVGLSMTLHLAFFGGIKQIKPAAEKRQDPVKVKIVEKEKPKPPEPTPVPEKTKPKKIPKRPKKPEQRKPAKTPKKNAQKVQGVTKESTVKDSTVAAPVGNTLMVEDKGIRLSAEELEALERDLSSDAILIRGSFVVPEYTQPALDANLEGRYIVDVFVDAKGNVQDAELRKKIGYGMDQRVIEVAMSARFTPRKNAKGVPLAGWAEIKFYLEIP